LGKLTRIVGVQVDSDSSILAAKYGMADTTDIRRKLDTLALSIV
jgi:hypothetical protein